MRKTTTRGRKPGAKKTGGRKKGTQNKVTTDLRASVKSFLDSNWPQVQAEFDQMEAKDKLAFIEKLMKYALPSLQAVQLDADIDLNKMDDAQLDLIINKITGK